MKQQESVEVSTDNNYIPSSQEKKVAILRYLFIGLGLSGISKSMSIYSMIHVKQAVAWRSLFFVLVVASLLLMWIPLIKIVPILAFIILLGVWVMMVHQSRVGKYNETKESIRGLFTSLGDRVLTILDISIKLDTSSPEETPSQNINK